MYISEQDQEKSLLLMEEIIVTVTNKCSSAEYNQCCGGNAVGRQIGNGEMELDISLRKHRILRHEFAEEANGS